AALLDLQVVAIRIWARVAFARVLERVVGGRVAGVDHIKRYAVRRPAKVGVQQAPAAGAGRVEPRGAVAVHRHRADVGVPDVAGRKDVAARARNGRRARVDRWPAAGENVPAKPPLSFQATSVPGPYAPPLTMMPMSWLYVASEVHRSALPATMKLPVDAGVTVVLRPMLSTGCQ